MGIHLKISTSLDVLSDRLISDLQADTPGVFDLQWIVTQTEGNNSRLRQQVALRTGIAANMQFIKMKDVLMKLYYALCPDTPLLLDKDSMTWVVYDLLNRADFIARFPAIAAYYTNNDTRRIALAAEMADLFDQYQVYRHDQIANWKKAIAEQDPDRAWQAYLWNEMRNRLGESYVDQIDVSDRLLEKIRDEVSGEKIQKIFPSLRFFGHAIFTPYYLEILSALSKVIDIRFYLLNPCPEHPWMHDISEKRIAALRQKKYVAFPETGPKGNELLVNWGNVLKESYYLLLSNEDYVNVYDVIDAPASEPKPATLLQQIQHEIQNSIPNEERGMIEEDMLNDGSLHLVGCYTPVREVEVLYNYLIHQFASQRDMGARDVLVMVTDIDLYAPFIRAVFNNGPVSIPYAIADESVSGGNSLFTALQQILSVHPDTFTSEEVLGLLDSPYIRKRFNFSDTKEVRRAVREAGIFFGHPELNPSYISDANEAWMVSWEYGLKKIMYGLCMSGEEVYDDGSQSLYPLDSAEGAAMSDRIRLYTFIQTLKDLLMQRAGNKTLSEWADYLGEVMRAMILDEDENDDDFPRFNRLLDTITPMQDVMSEPISFTTFRQVFFDKMSEERRSGSFAGKGVNFCSMIPMRSIPYKMIALLGMNFDTFPRQDSVLSFSLLAKGEKRKGDRSIRENDKHLFLESLLAAGEKLYISYLARDVQKGSEKPPSTLVDELLDYIDCKTDKDAEYKKNKTILHPLHLFSHAYHADGTRLLPNYLGNTLSGGQVFEEDKTASPESFDISEISLDQMGTFFKHPVKYFFNRILNVYYRSDEERLPETELFALNNLMEWKIKDDLLQPGTDAAEYTQRNKMKGQLPLATMGEVMVQQLKKEIHPLQQKFYDIIAQDVPQRIAIHYADKDTIVKGSLEVYGDKYVFICHSKSILKYVIVSWVNYLFARASGHDRLAFHFVFNNEKGDPETLFVGQDEISAAEVRVQVQRLISFFKMGHEQPFSFYAPFAYYYYHQPNGASEPVCQINREELYANYETFVEDDRKDKYNRVFTDGGYLEKVIEEQDTDSGYFSTASVDDMNENIPKLMQFLYEKAPKIFK